MAQLTTCRRCAVKQVEILKTHNIMAEESRPLEISSDFTQHRGCLQNKNIFSVRGEHAGTHMNVHTHKHAYSPDSERLSSKDSKGKKYEGDEISRRRNRKWRREETDYKGFEHRQRRRTTRRQSAFTMNQREVTFIHGVCRDMIATLNKGRLLVTWALKRQEISRWDSIQEERKVKTPTRSWEFKTEERGMKKWKKSLRSRKTDDEEEEGGGGRRRWRWRLKSDRKMSEDQKQVDIQRGSWSWGWEEVDKKKKQNKTKKPNKNKIMNTKNPQTQKQGHQTDQKQ